jgi:hypothetical protein
MIHHLLNVATILPHLQGTPSGVVIHTENCVVMAVETLLREPMIRCSATEATGQTILLARLQKYGICNNDAKNESTAGVAATFALHAHRNHCSSVWKPASGPGVADTGQ